MIGARPGNTTATTDIGLGSVAVNLAHPTQSRLVVALGVAQWQHRTGSDNRGVHGSATLTVNRWCV